MKIREATSTKFSKKLPVLLNASLILLMVLLGTTTTYSQADCSSAIIVCGNTQAYNPSGVGEKSEQLACGGIEHNSVWFAFQAKTNGTLNFVIRPTTLQGLPTVADVDWSLYQLAGAPGTSNCNTKTQLSCNFSGSSTVFGIPGATGMATPPYVATQFNPGIAVVSGTWYAIQIDKLSSTTQLLLSVQFTGNTESNHLNSTAGIFDNRPDFTATNASACSGTFNFNSSSSVSTVGITSYLWDFGDGSTSTAQNPSHSYITDGIYYVSLTITNSNGCKTMIRKKVIYNNTAPTINTSGLFVTPACSNSNSGTLTIVTEGATNPGVSGGTAPYTYELVSPSPMIRASQTSNTFTGLQPGAYTVKVTDACGKAVIGMVTITQIATNSLIGLSIQNIQSACTGSPTGSATIFANGTSPPYTMALVSSSPVTTSAQTAIQRDPVTATYYVTFKNLLPGVYTVEAFDGCGKARRATFTVNGSSAPIANSIASPSCTGTGTGTITVTATAATGLSGNGSPGSYQYALISPSPVNRAFQNSSVFENLTPGVYTVATKDACGNIGTSTVTVNTAVSPNFGTSFTSASCPNGNTGTIEVQNGTVAGGGSPYFYELIAPSVVTRPSQSSNFFNNLPAGSYTVRMTDVCGTKATTNLIVATVVAPTFTTLTSASCGATANGTITITPSSTSTGPYSFELVSPGGAIRAPQPSNIAHTNNSIFTGLSIGTYTVRMTDGCGIPITSTSAISSPTSLAFPTGSTSTPSCSASNTGQITVGLPTTGLGAYMYELISPSTEIRGPQSSRIFNNLPVGNYTVRIKDICGTQVDNSSSPISVGIATAPTLTVTNTSSCAASSGTITCTAATTNQGAGTYQFALISPSPVNRPNQTSPIFTGLQAGIYTVQITDLCNVTGTTTTTITAAGAFTPAAGGSVVRCSGVNYIGQIIVTSPQNFTSGGPIPAGSGGGPYTYAVYDAANTTLIAGPQASNVFSTITPIVVTPSHTIRVTDACNNTSTVAVTINPPTALTAAVISATTASCAGSSTGIIKVTTASTGGLAPFRYTLIDATTAAVVAGPQSSITFTNIPANATGYFVRTTDACGNVVTSSTALLFPAAVTPTANVATTSSCGSALTGRIVVTPGTGATLAGGTFSYSLYNSTNNTLIRNAQTSPVFENLGAGTYTARITDQCATTGTVTATINNNVTALTVTGTATNTCSGSSTGTITASSTGGSLPVTYTLLLQPSGTVVAGPQSDNVFSGLAANTYAVRVTDACFTDVNSADIVLGTISSVPTISTTTALDCSGASVIGGYGGGGSGGPYTYAFCSGAGCSSFGSFSNVSTFTIPASGTYRVAVRDRCDLQTSSSDIVISIPTKATITGIIKNNACGATTITVSASNIPNTPYYSLDGGNFTTNIGSVPVGSHTIRVANYNGLTFECASNPFSFTVSANQLPPNTTTNINICVGTSTALTATCTTGNVAWYGSNSTTLLSTVSPFTTPVLNTNTTYNVRCVSGSCLSNFVVVTVNTISPPTASASNTGPYLSGQTIGLNASGGTSYSWSGPNSFTSTTQNPTIANAQAFMSGIYKVSVSNGVCNTTATATTNVIVRISIPTVSNTTVCGGSTVNVSFTTAGTFNGGNQFQIQLSDAGGSFNSPTVIGTTSTGGIVACQIPSNTVEGGTYFLRVVSSNPVVAGNANASVLTIIPANKTLTTNYTTGTTVISAGVKIMATNKVISPANVTYKAGKAIEMNVGFSVGTGANFKTEIGGCPN